MAKKDAGRGKNKNKSKGPFGGGSKPNSQQAKVREFDRLMTKSEQLWEKGDIEGALEIAEDLVERNPKDVRPLLFTAMLYSEAGDVREALERAEAADKLMPNEPVVLSFLAAVYLLNERVASSVQTFRRLRTLDRTGEFFVKESRETLNSIEQSLKDEANQYKVPVATFEKALLMIEQGEVAIEEADFDKGLKLLQNAAETVPGWTLPRLSQSVYQWEAGHAQESLVTAQKLVDDAPDNLSALSHLATTLVWNNQTEQARSLLPRVETAFEREAAKIQTADEQELEEVAEAFYKTAVVFAAMGQDQRVYDILKQGEAAELEYDGSYWRWLAISAYNLGKLEESESYWQQLEPDEVSPFVLGLQETVARPRPADASPLFLPYFETSAFVPMPVTQQLLALKEVQAGANFEFDTEQVRSAYTKLSPDYQILTALTQNINFGMQPVAETNIGIMGEIRNAEVVSILKDYVQSYIGPEMARRYAVAHLVEWGELARDSNLHFWLEEPGGWQDLPISSFASLDEEEQRIVDDVYEYASLGGLDFDDFEGDDFDEEDEDL